MLKRLVSQFNIMRTWRCFHNLSDTVLICEAVKCWSGCEGFIRKGQEQMMCDYLWLELLERGIIK